MSTVLVFDDVEDLAGAQTDTDEVTLTWSAATPLFNFRNGDAELASMAGWTSVQGAWSARGPGLPGNIANPKEGSYIFHGGGGFALSVTRQRISPLSMGLTFAEVTAGKDITVKFWPGCLDQTNSESVRVNLYFYDEEEELLDSDIQSYINPGVAPSSPANSAIWASESSRSVEMPAGTCFIDVEMDGKRNNGVSCDACIDDLRIQLEDARPLPYVPGYAIYQDDVLVDTAPANATQFVVSGLSNGEYKFRIIAYDGTNFLSDLSNEVTVEVDDSAFEAVENLITIFDDEQVFTGYLGGRLKGKTVACAGRKANRAKGC